MTGPVERNAPADRYRVGRKLGRTIYRQHSTEPSDHDELLGVMDTPELGQLVVDALNTTAPDQEARDLAEGYRMRHQMSPSSRQHLLRETVEQSVEPERSAYASAAERVAGNLNDTTGWTWTCENADELGIDREAAMALIYRLKEQIVEHGRPLSRSVLRALTGQGGQPDVQS